ncbi:MAG TPA: GNAT family N-acetyltransferase [Parvibaculum sp.]|uniref:GNAT family N-acetyltransferase n=1 Tax=Parvibaculum sp. TaxID=2024848 RepID=UPI002CDD93E9|nr:GNAT family N-acetyltransferase [Parvibaculum sp.]HMM14053.1 GNAT family N-acetyltransferase [Parvibaculum sp.]
MTDLSIVPAEAGAAESLAALHRASFDEPWDAPSIAAILAMPGSFALLAVPDTDGARSASPAGFVLLRIAADEAEILTIAVDPALRRAGVGRRLVEAASALALAHGASALFLEVAEDNAPALALYEGAGFRTVGTRPGYYRRAGGAVSAFTMRLDLAGFRPQGAGA